MNNLLIGNFFSWKQVSMMKMYVDFTDLRHLYKFGQPISVLYDCYYRVLLRKKLFFFLLDWFCHYHVTGSWSKTAIKVHLSTICNPIFSPEVLTETFKTFQVSLTNKRLSGENGNHLAKWNSEIRTLDLNIPLLDTKDWC